MLGKLSIHLLSEVVRRCVVREAELAIDIAGHPEQPIHVFAVGGPIEGCPRRGVTIDTHDPPPSLDAWHEAASPDTVFRIEDEPHQDVEAEGRRRNVEQTHDCGSAKFPQPQHLPSPILLALETHSMRMNSMHVISANVSVNLREKGLVPRAKGSFS